jgi:hypothetical protein
MMKKLEVSDPNDIRILEITDFIMKEIESRGPHTPVIYYKHQWQR